ncbi:MAG: hypothetical protein GWN87_20460, partial [Desulfuromonadales bacterium]|nr:hypothetical protein [Desulfuromonadales bacterium]
YQTIDIETKSVFGQLIWQATPNLEIAGGLRWTDEERGHEVFSTNTYAVPAFAGIPPVEPGGQVQLATATPELASDHISPEL